MAARRSIAILVALLTHGEGLKRDGAVRKREGYNIKKVFWLNLDSDIHRREWMESQFENETLFPGIGNERIRAVSPDMPEAYEYQKQFAPRGCKFEFDRNCMSDLGHRAAYDKISQQTDGFYLFVEDDVRFHSNWHERWLELAPSMPHDWDMLRIAANGDSNFNEDRVNETHWVHCVKRHDLGRHWYVGAHAIVFTPQKAKAFMYQLVQKYGVCADAWTGKNNTFVTDENLLDSGLFTSTRTTGEVSTPVELRDEAPEAVFGEIAWKPDRLMSGSQWEDQ